MGRKICYFEGPLSTVKLLAERIPKPWVSSKISITLPIYWEPGALCLPPDGPLMCIIQYSAHIAKYCICIFIMSYKMHY